MTIEFFHRAIALKGKHETIERSFAPNHIILTFKTVSKTFERVCSVLELYLRGRDSNTRGRSKSALLERCEQPT
jgi:hypothetical protein